MCPLKFMKIVEKPPGRKPAGTEHLPGDVLAVGSQHKGTGQTDDYHQSYDPNYNPGLGFPNYKIARTFFFGGMKKQLRIPISNPNRVIIEPNPPR